MRDDGSEICCLSRHKGQDLGEEERVRDRHCEFFAAFLQARGEALKGRQQWSALREIQIEIDNARAAWEWAVERREAAWLDQALEGLFDFYYWRLMFREGEAACRMAVEALSTAETEPPATAERSSAEIATRLRVLSRLLALQGAFKPPI